MGWAALEFAAGQGSRLNGAPNNGRSQRKNLQSPNNGPLLDVLQNKAGVKAETTAASLGTGSPHA